MCCVKFGTTLNGNGNAVLPLMYQAYAEIYLKKLISQREMAMMFWIILDFNLLLSDVKGQQNILSDRILENVIYGNDTLVNDV